ncbi:DUF459 domain-containing protein [Aureimonas altamirensis]|uniref:SGNH/GDSL hydrolase family protein n=1 Tax=Aureimonas altamirensis TaxID=370622 RepID=UPI0020369CFC|nr:SGNH family hydrolase [Aureimonas altamirensis]MCM2503790.1 DUF459 domain-containing protein [Aureimonas altamirensis]
MRRAKPAGLKTGLSMALAAAVLITGVALPAPVAAQEQRPRNILEMLFGAPRQAEPPRTIRRQQAPRKQARQRRPAQPSRSQASRTAAPAPAPVAVAKAEDARRILVVGDFMAASLARGLADAFADDPNALVIGKANGSSGLVRDDFYDWNEQLPRLIEDEKPQVVVVMLGGNDRQAIRRPQGSIAVRTQDWTTEYERRAGALAEIVTGAGIPFVWIGQPSYQSDRMAEDMVFLNGIYQKAATAAGGEFVDVWGGFTDAGGSYISSGPDVEGQQRRLRNSDGITMTPAGAAKLAFFVEKPVQRLLGLADPALAPAAGETPGLLEAAPRVDPANATRVAPVSFGDPAFDGADGLLAAPAERPGPSETPSPRERLVRSGIASEPGDGRADSFSWPRDGG